MAQDKKLNTSNGDYSKASEKKRVVTSLKFSLPNVNLGFDSHFEIIKAYVIGSNNGKKPLGYNDLKSLLDFNPDSVSGCNKFFEHLGLIQAAEEQKGKYLPTQKALELFPSLKWKNDTESKSLMKTIVLDSWFWEPTHQLLEMKESVIEQELLEKLGMHSGADPEKHVRALHVLIEYLKYADLVKEHDGKLVLGNVNVSQTMTKKDETIKKDQGVEEKIEPSLAIKLDGINIGLLISPEMTEEQIRKTIRIIVDELSKIGEKCEQQ